MAREQSEQAYTRDAMPTGPCSSNANQEKNCGKGVGSGGTKCERDDRTEDVQPKGDKPEGDGPEDDRTQQQEEVEEEEEEGEDDLWDQPLLKLPPELRLQVYGYIFHSALDNDKPLDPKACFPVPPIVLAWSELEEECGAEWWRRLSDESTRLSCYQRQLDNMGPPGSKGHLMDGVHEEFKWTLLKQKQVEVLSRNHDAGAYGTSVVPHLSYGCQQRPWPLGPWYYL